MRYELRGSIFTSIKAIEITFDVYHLYAILEILNGGICIFEFRNWPKVEGFILREVFQRLCGFPFDTITICPPTNSLTILSRLLYHMVTYILIPKGSQKDDCQFFQGISS